MLDEIDGIKDDLKDLKAQAKDEGFNVAALLRAVAIRRNKGRVDQVNELLNDLLLYAHATETPLYIAFRRRLKDICTRPGYRARRRDSLSK